MKDKRPIYDHTGRSLLSFLLPTRLVKWLLELGPVEMTPARIASLERESLR